MEGNVYCNKDIVLKFEKGNFSEFVDILDKSLKDKIDKDLFKMLFNEEGEEPSIKKYYDNNSKENLENMIQKSYETPIIQKINKNNNDIKKNNINDQLNFFDKRKRKLSESDRKLITFKKNNLNITFNHNISIAIINNKIYENKLPDFQNKNIEKIDIDELFEDENKNDNPKILDINKIYLINNYLNIDRKNPLWYIYHLIAKSSFGPLSSEEIEEMYKANLINGLTLIRLIDVFSIDNVEPFNFIKLKEIEKKNFIKKIKVSSFIKVKNI